MYRCLENFPNTYLFSKNLAESVIMEYSSSLPCAIVRPSIGMSLSLLFWNITNNSYFSLLKCLDTPNINIFPFLYRMF